MMSNLKLLSVLMYDFFDKFHITVSTETPSCTRFHFLVSVNIQIIFFWNLIPRSPSNLGLLSTQIFQDYWIFVLICLRQNKFRCVGFFHSFVYELYIFVQQVSYFNACTKYFNCETHFTVVYVRECLPFMSGSCYFLCQ